MVIGPTRKAGAIASHCNFHENQEATCTRMLH
jgi:hypothetical protein